MLNPDGTSGRKETVAVVNTSDDTASVVLEMGGDVRLWSEFEPNLYELTVSVGDDERRVTFGMSEIAIKGKQFYLNGNPIWMRGTVGNCCFPLTGYPPTDEQSWLAIFRKCKEYGLNMMRFHSYCPPEAALPQPIRWVSICNPKAVMASITVCVSAER